jgi:hypothetical protein
VDSAKVAVWQTLFRRFAADSSSITAFRRREGVSAASFYLWRKRRAKSNGLMFGPAKPAKGPAFLPVRLTATAVSPIIIRLRERAAQPTD